MVTPIETRYSGCLFRSRLEARWAVFMDTLGLKWRYEPEGFKLPDGTCYLPDFYVEGIGWLEIKPSTDADDGKWEKFCDAYLEDPTFVAYEICGDIPSPFFYRDPCLESFYVRKGGLDGGWDNFQWWCICQECQKVGIQFEGRSERICRHNGIGDKGFTGDCARIMTALIAARSARF